jgi:hypothetical protein
VQQSPLNYPGVQGPGQLGPAFPPARSRSRGPIIAIVIAVVVLLVAAGAIATWLLLQESDDSNGPSGHAGATPSAQPTGAPSGRDTVTMLEGRGFECFLPYQEEATTPEVRTCYLQVNAEKDFYVGLEYKRGELAYLDSIMIDDPRNPNPEAVRADAEELFDALIAEMVPEQDVPTVTTWMRDHLQSPDRAEQTYGDVQLGVRLADYGYRLQAVYLPLDFTPIERDALPDLTAEQARALFTEGGAECGDTECEGNPNAEGHAVGGILGVLSGDPSQLESLAIDVATAGEADIAAVTAEGVRPFLEATMGRAGADQAIEWMAEQHDGTLHAGDFAGVHITIHSATITENGTQIPVARVLLSPTTI